MNETEIDTRNYVYATAAAGLTLWTAETPYVGPPSVMSNPLRVRSYPIVAMRFDQYQNGTYLVDLGGNPTPIDDEELFGTDGVFILKVTPTPAEPDDLKSRIEEARKTMTWRAEWVARRNTA